MSSDTSNLPPVFATVPSLTATAGQSYTYALAASAVDGGPITFGGEDLPAWLTLTDHGDGTATLSGTPPAAGNEEIVLTASRASRQATQAFTLGIASASGNQPPVFTSTPPTLVNAGDPVLYTVATSDPDGQVPAISASLLPTWLSLTDHGDGTATLAGTAPDSELTQFRVILVASDGLSATAQGFNLAVNRAPRIALISPPAGVASLSEPGTLLLVTEVTDDGLPESPGAVSLAWTTVSGPEAALFAAPGEPSTAVTFTAPGSYHLRLTADDGLAVRFRDLFISVGENPNAALASGLLGYWRFDETGGTTAADSSGNENTLSLTGAATFGLGYSGNALVTNASNTQHAQTALGQPAQLTFTAWILSDVAPSDGTTERVIFGFLSGTNSRARLILKNGQSRLRFISSHATRGEWETSDYLLPAGEWVHVALRYDQSSVSHDPSLWINGEAVALTRVVAPSGTINSTNNLRIGGQGSVNNTWKGRIDEVRVYERLLTPAELAASPLPAPVNQAPLVSAALQNPIAAGQSSGVLVGTVEDDGLPSGGQITTLWERIAGPESVVIADEESLETAVSFTANGSYTFRFTAFDGELASSVELSFDVFLDDPEPTSVVVTPASATVSPGGQIQFEATVLDQFGQTMEGQGISWQLGGGGTIDASGAFTAGATEGGPFTVTASSGALNGTAEVTIFDQPPTISAIADQVIQTNAATDPISFTVADAETPAPSLQVTAASDNAVLIPAAGLALGGSGADRTLVVTPAAGQTGTATITVTVTDGAGKSAQTAFQVSVQAGIPTSIVVTPANVDVLPTATLAFSAVVLDQNELPLNPQPPVTWSVDAGGSISADGFFTAGVPLGGPHTVTASFDGIQGTASVTIANTAPTIQIVSPAVPLLGLADLDNHLLLHAEADDAETVPSVTWSQVSGPVGGTAVFAAANAAQTSVHFPVAGTYVLRATASDGFLSAQEEITVEAGATPGTGGSSEPVQLFTTDFGTGVTNTGLAQITFSGDNGNKGIGFSGAGGTSGAGDMWTLGDTGLLDFVALNSVSLGGFAWGSVNNPIRRGVIFTTTGDFGFLTNGTNTNIRYTGTGATNPLVQLGSGSAHDIAFNLLFEVKPDATLSDLRVTFRAGTSQTNGTWHNNTAAENGSINVVIHPLNSSGVAGTGISFFASPQAISAGAGPSIDAAAPEGTSLAAGRYLLRIVFSGKTRNERASIDDLTFFASTGPAAIPFAPTVDPGTAPGAEAGSPASLTGSASDPGENPLVLQWSRIAGPGAADFATPGQGNSQVTFSMAGEQTLRLSSVSAIAGVFQDLLVTVSAGTGDPNLESLFDAWAGDSELPPDQRGMMDTPYNDGIPNLARFALALSSDGPLSGSLWPGEEEDGSFVITYTRRADLPGLTVATQMTTDLIGGSWTSTGVQETVVSEENGIQTVRAEAATPPAGPVFLRVNLSIP